MPARGLRGKIREGGDGDIDVDGTDARAIVSRAPGARRSAGRRDTTRLQVSFLAPTGCRRRRSNERWSFVFTSSASRHNMLRRPQLRDGIRAWGVAFDVRQGPWSRGARGPGDIFARQPALASPARARHEGHVRAAFPGGGECRGVRCHLRPDLHGACRRMMTTTTAATTTLGGSSSRSADDPDPDAVRVGSVVLRCSAHYALSTTQVASSPVSTCGVLRYIEKGSGAEA